MSITGITGAATATEDAIVAAVERLRRHTDLPVAVGFGIRTPERAAEVARVADAAVVGSALVDEIANALGTGASPAAKVLETAAALAQGVRFARRQMAQV